MEDNFIFIIIFLIIFILTPLIIINLYFIINYHNRNYYLVKNYLNYY
jgi:hypothetical protein